MTDGNSSVKRLLQQNQTTVLRRVGEVSQAVVAERANLSPSLVSRILSGKDAKEGDDELGGALHRVLSILAGCNLVVVPREFRHVDPDEYRAVQVLATKRLQDEQVNSGFGELPAP